MLLCWPALSFRLLPLLLLVADAQQFNNGLLTLERPPIQSSVQRETLQANTRKAGQESNDNRYQFEQILKNAAKNLADYHPIKQQHKEDDAKFLTDWFTWEFQRLPIIHNGPVFDNGDGQFPLDDTDVFTTLSNGYVQNIVHRFVLGRENQNDYYGQNSIMETYLNYPKFKNDQKPTLNEANQRIVYGANNWDKKHCGNYEYGSVTYHINPVYKDKYYYIGFDSGKYYKTGRADYCNRGFCMGTDNDFKHVVRQHHEVYSNYNMADIFNRWYNPDSFNASSIDQLKYFEVEFSANMWLPEALLYLTVKYSDLWSTPAGQWVREWSKDAKRPLVWADADTSGMLLDPYVGNVQVNLGGDMQTFQQKWQAGGQQSGYYFEQLYNACSNATKLDFREYFRLRTQCEDDEKDSSKMILGVNFNQQCVYNTYQTPAPMPSGPTPAPGTPTPAPGPSPSPGISNQQFIGPNEQTNWAIVLKESCDDSGENCKKCVDLQGGQPKESAKVDLWDCNGHANQQWNYDTNSQTIQYKNDQKWCIDAGSTMSAGSDLMLWECNGQPQQKWSGWGKYQWRLQAGQNMCMDLSGGNQDNGTPIEIWGCDGGSGPVPSPPPPQPAPTPPPPAPTPNTPPPTPPTPPTPTIPNQQWMGPSADTKNTILYKGACYPPCVNPPCSNSRCSKCLDLKGDMAEDGTPIDIWDCSGIQGQVWKYDPQTQWIVYAGEKTKVAMCVTAPPKNGQDPQSAMYNGNKLILYGCLIDKWTRQPVYPAQQWVGEGVFQFKSLADQTKCVDLSNNGEQDNGTPVQLWDCINYPPSDAATVVPAPTMTNTTTRANEAEVDFRARAQVMTDEDLRTLSAIALNGTTSSGSGASSTSSVYRSSGSSAPLPFMRASAGAGGYSVECLNDGSCYQARQYPNPNHARYGDMSSCSQDCGNKWGCMSVTPDHGQPAKYCIPNRQASPSYGSEEECLSSCS